jgi:hypothetical protein
VAGVLTQASWLTNYEETSNLIAYGGNWTSTTSVGNYSGGTLRYASGAGTGFKVAFNGSAIEWMALTGPSYGIAQVELDGVLQPDVDLYNSTYQFRQLVFQTAGLTPGPHTFVVRWTGRKNASSSDYRINLDAVNVADTLTQASWLTNYEETSTLLAYGGVWTSTTSIGNYSGGTLSYANGAGTGFTAAFNGSDVVWTALTGPSYGIAEVRIDGVLQRDVDLYSSTYQFRQPVFQTAGLTPGPHRLDARWTGRKNPLSSDYRINLDAVGVAGTLTQASWFTIYEETSTLLAYGGVWTSTTSVGNYSGGTLSYANGAGGAGAGFTAAFSGTAAEWMALTGPSYGIAQVVLDGVLQPDVDLYSPTYKFRQFVFQTAALTAGPHTLVVSWTGRKNPLSSDYRINLDAIGVAGTLTQAP